MKTKPFINKLIIAFLALVFFTTCKKEISKIDSFTSFGRVYPIKGSQNIAGAIRMPDEGYLLWGDADAGSHGKQDGFLMRLDKDYNQLWYKTYGGFSNDYFESATLDNQGNILVCGTSTSFGISLDTNSIVPNPCMYAVYTKANGELIWQKTYNGNPKAANILNNLCKVLLLPNQNFALIGYTNNYIQKFGSNFYYVPNALIQCINKQGDTLWQSNYNYFDTISPLPIDFLPYMASNAVLSPDGNIEMMVVKSRGGADNFPLSFIKVSPNSKSGYNSYISRKPINGFFNQFRNSGTYDKPFFPMLLINESQETYLVAAETEMLICLPNGTLLKRITISQGFTIQDMTYNNGFAFFATKDELIKVDLNGIKVWDSSINDEPLIERVKGIFIENDKSISVFCSYINTLGAMDLALLRINENGQLILK